jgi:hypothetical protein
MLFSSVPRVRRGSGFPSMRSLERTLRQWLYSCSGQPTRVAYEGSPPQVAVIIGEIIGHFANDAIMRATTRRNHGVFEAESRLW